MERISYKNFHKVQIGSYLIQKNIKNITDFSFDSMGNIKSYGLNKSELEELIDTGNPFIVLGCPDCNRIYYETIPGERFYTYPRQPNESEIVQIKNEIMEQV